MIISAAALEALFQQGRTIVRLSEFEGAHPKFRWVTTDTNETVHAAAVKQLVAKERCRPIAFDLCGDPMQLGAANA